MLRHVSISTRKISYDLYFRSKYTVLTGLSGAGKTLLINTVQRLNRAFPDATYDGYKVYASVYSQDLTDTILSESGALIIMDEDVDSEARKKFFPSIRDSKNFFIFITRDIYGIPFGIDDIFELKGNEKHKRMEQRYNNYIDPLNGDTLLCEDSASGYHITKKIFEQYGYTVSSARGKDKIIPALLKLNKGNVILIADLCGLGATTFPLMDFIARKTGYALYPSMSFEYELLANPLIKSIELRDPDPEVLLNYQSEEFYYTSVVSSILFDRYGIKYAKSSKNVVQFLMTGYLNLGGIHTKHPTTIKDSWLYPLLSHSSDADNI